MEYIFESTRVKLVKDFEVPYLTPVKTPDDAISAVKELIKDLATEDVYGIFMDIKGNINAISRISTGNIDSSNSSPREIIQIALLSNAKSIILMHNHPSGDVVPSNDDYRLTKKIKEACKMMDLNLLDHIVVGMTDSYSMKANNEI